MFLVTTGYGASWQPWACSQSKKHVPLSGRFLPRAGSQCGVGETSLKTVSRLPESALAPLQPAEHSCLEFQPDLQKQLPCGVQRWAEAGDVFPLLSGFQRLCSDFISLLQCRSLCYPEYLRCGSPSIARMSMDCWGQLNTAGVGHWADPFLVWRLGAGTLL